MQMKKLLLKRNVIFLEVLLGETAVFSLVSVNRCLILYLRYSVYLFKPVLWFPPLIFLSISLGLFTVLMNCPWKAMFSQVQPDRPPPS